MLAERMKAHWFWPVATLLVGLAWLMGQNQQPAVSGWEAAVLFDVFVSIPLLFFLCYRSSLSKKDLVLRVLALQCLGIWIASKIVPVSGQKVLPDLVWLRYAGLAVLLAIEVRLMVAVLKLMFAKDATSEQLEQVGMPPILAKLALMEARFWRWLSSFFRK